MIPEGVGICAISAAGRSVWVSVDETVRVIDRVRRYSILGILLLASY
jgi:hypothetical protein